MVENKIYDDGGKAPIVNTTSGAVLTGAVPTQQKNPKEEHADDGVFALYFNRTYLTPVILCLCSMAALADLTDFSFLTLSVEVGIIFTSLILAYLFSHYEKVPDNKPKRQVNTTSNPDAPAYSRELLLSLRPHKVDMPKQATMNVMRSTSSMGISGSRSLSRQYAKRIAAAPLDAALEMHEEMIADGIPADLFSYSALITACKKDNNVQAGLEQFEKMRADNIKPDTVTYNNLIVACNRGHVAHRSFDLYNEMIRTNVEPDAVTFTSLIASCARESRGLKGAEPLFQEMRRRNLQTNRATYNSMISVCAADANHIRAGELYEEMLSLGFEPIKMTFDPLISTYAKCSNPGLATKVLDDMRKAEIMPDVKSYNTVLFGCAKGALFKEAEDIFEQMAKDTVHPDARTYNAMVSVCAKNARLDRGEELFEQMKRTGFSPETTTYNSIISAAGKANDVERAFALFEEMKLTSLRPDSATYNALLSAAAKTSLDRGFGVLQDMRKARLNATPVAYTALIAASSKGDTPERAKEFFDYMVNDGIIPNEVSYTSMICAEVKQLKLDDATYYFDKMKSEQLVPYQQTYKTLLHGYVRVGDTARAKTLLEEMQSKGFSADRNIVHQIHNPPKHIPLADTVSRLSLDSDHHLDEILNNSITNLIEPSAGLGSSRNSLFDVPFQTQSSDMTDEMLNSSSRSFERNYSGGGGGNSGGGNTYGSRASHGSHGSHEAEMRNLKTPFPRQMSTLSLSQRSIPEDSQYHESGNNNNNNTNNAGGAYGEGHRPPLRSKNQNQSNPSPSPSTNQGGQHRCSTGSQGSGGRRFNVPTPLQQHGNHYQHQYQQENQPPHQHQQGGQQHQQGGMKHQQQQEHQYYLSRGFNTGHNSHYSYPDVPQQHLTHHHQQHQQNQHHGGAPNHSQRYVPIAQRGAAPREGHHGHPKYGHYNNSYTFEGANFNYQ